MKPSKTWRNQNQKGKSFVDKPPRMDDRGGAAESSRAPVEDSSCKCNQSSCFYCEAAPPEALGEVCSLSRTECEGKFGEMHAHKRSRRPVSADKRSARARQFEEKRKINQDRVEGKPYWCVLPIGLCSNPMHFHPGNKYFLGPAERNHVHRAPESDSGCLGDGSEDEVLDWELMDWKHGDEEVSEDAPFTPQISPASVLKTDSPSGRKRWDLEGRCKPVWLTSDPIDEEFVAPCRAQRDGSIDLATSRRLNCLPRATAADGAPVPLIPLPPSKLDNSDSVRLKTRGLSKAGLVPSRPLSDRHPPRLPPAETSVSPAMLSQDNLVYAEQAIPLNCGELVVASEPPIVEPPALTFASVIIYKATLGVDEFGFWLRFCRGLKSGLCCYAEISDAPIELSQYEHVPSVTQMDYKAHTSYYARYALSLKDGWHLPGRMANTTTTEQRKRHQSDVAKYHKIFLTSMFKSYAAHRVCMDLFWWLFESDGGESKNLRVGRALMFAKADVYGLRPGFYNRVSACAEGYPRKADLASESIDVYMYTLVFYSQVRMLQELLINDCLPEQHVSNPRPLFRRTKGA